MAPFFMENNLYTNLGKRINKTFRDKRDHDFLTIKDFLENKWQIIDSNDLNRVFIKELKSLLTRENLFDLINSFFELEANLQLAQERLGINEDISNFEEFYKNLSPVMMRSLLEVASTNSNESILNALKESIRIAIESEIYNIEVI